MHLECFITRIETQEAVIGVVGLGYVGLPLIMECCRKGFKVIGFDHDKISALNLNESYIHSPKTASFTEKKVLDATTDFSRVADPRESPGIAMLEKLHARGVNVSYNDPYIPILPVQENHDLHLRSVELTADILESCDAVLIATAHSEYDYSFIVNHSPLVIDTRNVTRGLDDPDNKIVKA